MPAETVDVMTLPLGDEHVEVSLLDVTRMAETDATATRFLTLRERAEYARLRHPGRRREWLGARVCLKTMLLRNRSVSDPTECEIMKDARGRPWLSFAPGLPGRKVYDCSLSHKGRFASACASAMADRAVGVDVEEISPRLLRLAGAFVGDRATFFRSRPPEERLALLWALKEARAKAVGGGIGTAMQSVTCEETAVGRHRITAGDGLQLRARHLVYEGYIIAVCVNDKRRDCDNAKTAC